MNNPLIGFFILFLIFSIKKIPLYCALASLLDNSGRGRCPLDTRNFSRKIE